jgi:type IV pilus assembly protein PilQ
MKTAHHPWAARAARASRRLGLALCLLGTAAMAMAQNSLEAVTASLQDGQEIVKIDLAQPLAVAPTGFVMQSPARIALDLPAIGNSTGRTSYEFGMGNLKSMTCLIYTSDAADDHLAV